MAYNRTILELKFNVLSDVGDVQLTYNRTILELKLSALEFNYLTLGAYNRTILELKFRCPLRASFSAVL